MKRLSLGLASLFMVVLLTGCGGKEKTLECTMNQNSTGAELSQVYTLKFDKKEDFASAVLKQDIKVDETLLKTQSLNDLKKNFEDNWKESGYESMPYKVTDNGKDTVTLTVDFDKKDIKKIAGSDKASFKDVKETLEKGNYTCSVK